MNASSKDAGKSASHPATKDAAPSSEDETSSDDGTSDGDSDGNAGGSDDDAGSAPPPSADGSDAGTTGYDWPSDCENRYTYVAHNANGVNDTSKRKVPAGAQFYSSAYFTAPWGTQDVQGLKFRSIIDNHKIVHHWILYGVDSADGSKYANGSVQGAQGQQIGTMPGEFYIAGWAPGAPDITLPTDVGLHMPAGATATFRLEVHYFNITADAVEEEDASGVEFCVTSQKREHEAAIHWMGTTNIIIPPGTPTDIKSTCKPNITNGPVHLMSLSAHMHKTGVHARAMLNRAGGGAQVMLIDDPFSFAEQNAYPQPRDGMGTDVLINAGDSVDVTCSYQNMTTGFKTFGENTDDEMCFFYALAWPRGQLNNGSTSVVPGAEPEVNCIK